MMTTAAEKELHIQLWRESGLSKAAYARESGLNANTFYSWFYTNESSCSTDQSAFVEIIAEEKQQNSEITGSRSIGITLGNGYNIIVPAGFQSHTLTAVLDVLEGR